jgi:hypothetical protein
MVFCSYDTRSTSSAIERDRYIDRISSPQTKLSSAYIAFTKEGNRELSEVSEEDGDFFADLCRCGLSLVLRYKLEQSGYRLIVNGGAYQEFPQLHFHLTSNEK